MNSIWAMTVYRNLRKRGMIAHSARVATFYRLGLMTYNGSEA